MNTLIDDILDDLLHGGKFISQREFLIQIVDTFEGANPMTVRRTKAKSELLKAILDVVGEDEDDRWENDKGEYIQDYEDACDKESRNEFRQELRTKLTELFEGK